MIWFKVMKKLIIDLFKKYWSVIIWAALVPVVYKLLLKSYGDLSLDRPLMVITFVFSIVLSGLTMLLGYVLIDVFEDSYKNIRRKILDTKTQLEVEETRKKIEIEENKKLLAIKQEKERKELLLGTNLGAPKRLNGVD